VLAGLTAQPASLLRRSGFEQELGAENIAPDLVSALERARQLAVQQ
jgi:hypothetical protein